MEQWKFSDPPNVAVIINKKIVNDGLFIAYVSHDADDGGWQFHILTTEPVSEGDAMLVSLRSVVQIDSTIEELSDLPLGWHAWRDNKNTEWQRAKQD